MGPILRGHHYVSLSLPTADHIKTLVSPLLKSTTEAKSPVHYLMMHHIVLALYVSRRRAPSRGRHHVRFSNRPIGVKRFQTRGQLALGNTIGAALASSTSQVC
jgi:hypothetical protein